MNQEETVPIANPMVVFREEFDDWAILFDPDSGKAFGINPVGALIWKRLDGKHDINSILKDIRDRFSDAPEDTESHLREFLQMLIKNGFAGIEA
jgi:SynChlorMet cassette protein ScmD